MSHIERIIPDQIIDRNFWLAKENELLREKIYFMNKEIASNSELLNCHIKRYLFASHTLRSRSNIIDIGCGVGYGSEILSRYANQVTGIDKDQSAIDYAINRYQHKNISFHCCLANLYDFTNHTFDAVVAFEIIEHLQLNDSLFLLEKLRKANNDTKLILSTPIADDGSNPFHLKTYSIDDFNQLVQTQFTINDRFFQAIDGNIGKENTNYIYIVIASTDDTLP